MAGSEDFQRARRETIRYHEQLYASAEVGTPGTWLAEPHPLLAEALRRLQPVGPVTAYDLGAGVGRHTLPMLRVLPAGSQVYAVDLLQSALDRIDPAVSPDMPAELHTVRADLADFAFAAAADLVFAFSAVEHLPDVPAIRALLTRIRSATKPAGVVALGVVADRVEIRDDGSRRPALLESALTADAARQELTEAFAGFSVDRLRSDPAQVREERDGESYLLGSTLVTFLAARPR